MLFRSPGDPLERHLVLLTQQEVPWCLLGHKVLLLMMAAATDRPPGKMRGQNSSNLIDVPLKKKTVPT